ncbi:MAG: TorF family putative porin [Porticoccaceae bacterium]|nr:TorF family putative porin [Porticoccaceae bacterium]MDG1474252.1 TorF family putative porin [Porticoccaceae bacterium]
MKAFKTAVFVATMMTAATGTTAEISGNVALGSDYFFRGVDQAGGEALSGGFDVAFENGFYAGTWASSIDFSNGPELDYYAGYGGSFSDSLSFDVGYLFYGYPGDSALDFEEFYGSLSMGDATVGFNYSDDYFDSTGETTYLYIDYGFALTESLSLGLHYGTISADDSEAYNAVFGDTIDDYSISLSTEFSGVGVDLSLVDSSGSGALDADTQFVVTFSKSL